MVLKITADPEEGSFILLAAAIEDVFSCKEAGGARDIAVEDLERLRGHVKRAAGSMPRDEFIPLYGECLLMLECAFCKYQITPQNRQETLVALLSHLMVSQIVGEVVQKVMGFNAFLQERRYSISLDVDEDFVKLNINLAPMIEEAPVSLVYGISLFYYNLLVWLTSREISLYEIGLPTYARGRSDMLNSIFDMKISYVESGSHLLFAREVMDYRVVRSPYDIEYAVNSVARDPLFFARRESLLRVRVRNWLQKSAFAEKRLPDIHSAAAQFGMGCSTLSRYLKAEGTSFLQLKHDVQRELAQRMLGEGGQTVKEVARSLGYNSARSFRRAFVAWTGRLPSEVKAVPPSEL